jgi:hypothetical protein
MKTNSEANIQKFAAASRKIFISFLMLFLASGLISTLLTYLELNVPALGWVAGTLLLISFGLLAVSWITPEVLMLAGAPELGLAWLRGMNWISPAGKPWTELSTGERGSVYVAAIVLSLLAITAISVWLL